MKLNNLSKIFRSTLFLPIFFIIVLSIPHLFQKYFEIDEGVYAAVATSMLNGEVLYKDVWDHKPPLIYIIYMITSVLGPISGMFLLRFAAIVIKILNIIIFYYILKKLGVGKKTSSFVLSIISLLLVLPILEGNTVNVEVFFVPIISLFILRVLNNRLSYFEGFLLFLSFCFKFQAFAEILFVAGIYIFSILISNRKLLIKELVKFLVGFLFPLLIMIFVFIISGNLEEAYKTLITINFGYADQTTYTVNILGSVIGRSLLLLVLFISAVAAVSVRYIFLNKRNILTQQNYVLINIIIFEIFLVLYPQRSYPHYLIQLMPGILFLLIYFVNNFKETTQIFLKFTKLLIFISGFGLLLFLFTEQEGNVGKVLNISLSPYFYYSSFFQDTNKVESLFFQKDNLTENFSEYIANNYSDYKRPYLYTSNTWVFTFSKLPFINNYFFYVQMYFTEEMYAKEKANILSADIIFLQSDLAIKPSLKTEINESFIEVEQYKGFQILKRE